MSTIIVSIARQLRLKKVDARKPMLLEVLPKDAKLGKEKDPRSCAFAEACMRSTDGVTGVFFFRTTAWVQYADKLVRYLLPASMQKEIVSFDRGAGIEPGIYQMSPPPKHGRLDAVLKRSRKRKGRHKPTGKHPSTMHRHFTTNVRGSKVEP